MKLKLANMCACNTILLTVIFFTTMLSFYAFLGGVLFAAVLSWCFYYRVCFLTANFACVRLKVFLNGVREKNEWTFPFKIAWEFSNLLSILSLVYVNIHTWNVWSMYWFFIFAQLEIIIKTFGALFIKFIKYEFESL